MINKTSLYFTIGLLLLSVAGVAALHAEKPDTRVRDEIPDRYKWDFSHIYADWDTWRADLQKISPLTDQLNAYKGTLTEGPEQLVAAIAIAEELGKTLSKVYAYPNLMLDTDQTNNTIRERKQEVLALYSAASIALSWISPELLEIPEEQMLEWLEMTPELEERRFSLLDQYRTQAHILDEKSERLLSYFSGFNRTPRQIYQSLQTADMDFPEVTFSDGETQAMTYGNYSLALRTKENQADRRAAFEAHYGAFENQKNAFAEIYNAVLQRDWALAQARNHESTLEAQLIWNDIPVDVVENLIATVRKGNEPVQRYHRLRREFMGLEEYYLFDSALPLIPNESRYHYDEIAPDVLESVSILGDVYSEDYKYLLDRGLIDVYENDGKRPGAYMSNVYGVYPYILLNHNDTLDSAFTLAHEMGHAMHSVLSDRHQPYATARYTIFVAEAAAITNEMLLLDQLKARTTDPAARINLLAKRIEDILGTFYSQVQFADYELQAFRRIEAGQPITADILSGIKREISTAFYGDSVSSHELYDVLWARISHFYNSPFYVYQYATCYASSAKLMESIRSDDPEVREAGIQRYLDLLKAGGSKHPMDLLKDAGVDLSDPATVQAVVDDLDRLVTELETELIAYKESLMEPGVK